MYEETAYCRKCGRMIRFLRTKKGKLAPVDSFSLNVVPKAEGGIFFREDGSTVRGVVVSAEGPNSVRAWQSHFVTCPEGEAFKNRQRQETWKDKQSKLAHERLEKEIAEAEAKAARRAERERKEAAQREIEDAQISLFGT